MPDPIQSYTASRTAEEAALATLPADGSSLPWTKIRDATEAGAVRWEGAPVEESCRLIHIKDALHRLRDAGCVASNGDGWRRVEFVSASTNAALAADALPAALAAYVRAARAFRAARLDFGETLVAACDAPVRFAHAELEELFAGMNVANNEARRFTEMASAAGRLAIESGTLSAHDVNVCLARGQAREMLACDCGKCDTCAIRIEAIAAGRDPLDAFAARLLAQLEPSGLVTPDGAPLAGPSVASPNRHARRAEKARGRLQ